MYEFKLPDLGEGIHEGEILEWHVKPGDEVDVDSPLVTVETDKVAVTIPSPVAGTVVETRGSVGDEVKTGEVLVVIDPKDGERKAAQADKKGAKVQEAPHTKKEPATEPPARTDSAKDRKRAGKVVPAAPSVRRLARELGVDLSEVPGSGPAGRVTADDIRKFASGQDKRAVTGRPTEAVSGTAPPEVGPGAPEGATQYPLPYVDAGPLPDFSAYGPIEQAPFRGVRRRTAVKTATSMAVVPHVAHMDEADVTELDRLRRSTSSPMSLLAFVVKAVASVLPDFPAFNASLDHLRDVLIYKKYYNIGVAVDTPKGLLVPNIKNADRLSVASIAKEIRRLAEKARDGEIELEELHGGTFSITNIGSVGGRFFFPAINYPETAILGMGRASLLPRVVGEEIEPRLVLPLVLSFDHRVADGVAAARFVGRLKALLESPMKLLLEA